MRALNRTVFALGLVLLISAAAPAADRAQPQAVFLLTPSKAIELATGNSIKLGQQFDLRVLKRTFKNYSFDQSEEEGETYWGLTRGSQKSPMTFLSLQVITHPLFDDADGRGSDRV